MRGWLIALALLAVAPSALAQNTEEGRAHFSRGVEFYKEGDFRGALIEFKRAYEIAPNYKVQYNLGQTSLELQDYAAALSAFRRYLDEGDKDVPADRRKQVEGEIRKLQGRVARVSVTTNLEGADVLVDDVVVGKTPLSAPLVVSAGRRKISVAKAGAPTQTRALDLAGGDNTTVALDVPEPAPSPTIAPVTPLGPSATPAPIVAQTTPAAPSRGASTATFVGVAVTGALAVGAIVTGSLALASKSQFDDALATPGADARIKDARDKTRAFAVTTDVLAGAAIAGGVVTLILALTTRGPAKTEARVRFAADGARFSF